MSFKPNFTKKQYDRQISLVKQQYKSNSTLRDNILRKLEVSAKYDNDYENLKEIVPNGLELSSITNNELLNLAHQEILQIATENAIESDNLTNYRFYVNTPYFDRKGTDEFPLFHLNDSRVKSIKELIQTSSVLKNKEYDPALLNILVRVYKGGDTLSFHTDRDIFGEEIYGLVVYNDNQERGIMLSNGKARYIVPESNGLIWKLSEESRWNFEHGYCSSWKNNDVCRIVISFRFFQNLKQIPKKEYEPLH